MDSVWTPGSAYGANYRQLKNGRTGPENVAVIRVWNAALSCRYQRGSGRTVWWETPNSWVTAHTETIGSIGVRKSGSWRVARYGALTATWTLPRMCKHQRELLDRRASQARLSPLWAESMCRQKVSYRVFWCEEIRPRPGREELCCLRDAARLCWARSDGLFAFLHAEHLPVRICTTATLSAVRLNLR